MAPGTVGVGTARDVEVPVFIEMHEVEPSWDLSRYDHVVDCALSVSSGTVVAAGCTDYFPEAERVAVAPGT